MARLGPAFDFAMALEGGGRVHTVSGDPGGTTKWGISQRANPDLDIASLTRSEAIEVYRERYWNPRLLGQLSAQEMADEIFEFTINADSAYSSRGRAVRVAQQRANEVLAALGISTRLIVDGQMGPQTISALNRIAEAGPVAVMAWDGTGCFNVRQLSYYRRLRRDLVEKFLLGWTRRVEA